MNLEEHEYQEKVLNEEYEVLLENKKFIQKLEKYNGRTKYLEFINNIFSDIIKNREVQTECLKQQLSLLNK